MDIQQKLMLASLQWAFSRWLVPVQQRLGQDFLQLSRYVCSQSSVKLVVNCCRQPSKTSRGVHQKSWQPPETCTGDWMSLCITVMSCRFVYGEYKLQTN